MCGEQLGTETVGRLRIGAGAEMFGRSTEHFRLLAVSLIYGIQKKCESMYNVRSTDGQFPVSQPQMTAYLSRMRGRYTRYGRFAVCNLRASVALEVEG